MGLVGMGNGGVLLGEREGFGWVGECSWAFFSLLGG